MKRRAKQLDRARLRCVIVVWGMLLGTQQVVGADFFVNNAAEIATALQSVQPGDTLVLANGTWTDQDIEFNGFGTQANPITLRAETPGQVILNGSSTLDISGDWLVVDGLHFNGGALAGGGRSIVEFRGDFGLATNSRFTNSAITSYNPSNINDRYHWVELFGQNNRVDNNRFEDHNHSGVTVSIRRRDGSGPSTEDFHRIDSNHFIDRPEGNANGFESIRLGTSARSLSSSFSTVENNLFERTDGEIEIISNKSGGNNLSFNTFRESAGTLTLRHGNDNRVEGNFFLGENKNESGGIRIIGERQTVINNYIANVDDRAGGAISLTAGEAGGPLNSHAPVVDTVIAHNTVVNVSGPAVTFDDGFSSVRSTLPSDLTLANNLFQSSGATIFEGNEGSNWEWQGNIAFGGSLGPKAGDPGITVVDPQLQLEASSGLFRPSSSSPAIDGGVGSFSNLFGDDIDGQPRIGIFDVGADEFSTAALVRRPLEAGDVGPAWLITEPPVDPPSGGGCFANGCAIQAEDFSALLDPNNNGLVWDVENVPEALGGEALVAPNGSRVDLASDDHDAIATYEVTFEQAGTYRAYYRARGFNGSTDSIFVPDGFGIDPDNNESLSSNGEFRWGNGGLFTITSSQVGVPLEFRIGRREELAELDALVLDLDLSLSPTELDALFDVIIDPADFNEDGFVDDADLVALQAGYGLSSGASQSDGDADGDGDVDGFDFLEWQRRLTGSGGAVSAFTTQVPEPTSIALLFMSLWMPSRVLRSKYRSR